MAAEAGRRASQQPLLVFPWETQSIGKLSRLGEWYNSTVGSGPLRYWPMVLAQLAFLPVLYGFAVLPWLAKVPSVLAAATTWAWAKVSLSPELGLFAKTSAARLLELPATSANEVIWKGILQTVLPLLPAAYFFVALPVLDLLIGRESNSKSVARKDDEAQAYRPVLWCFGIIYCCLLFMCAKAASGLPVLSAVSLGLGLGFYGAVLFAVAHELIHSRHKADIVLSKVLLTCLCYPHYERSHKLIHHVRVSTLSDPSSAYRGQSVYSFILRSVWENWTILQEMETNRATKASWILGPLFTAGTLVAFFGPKALLVLVFSSLVSILNLEIVQYLEHYGLQRKKLPNGKYEQVNKTHSWNADWLATNSHIVNLQLHGDHHINATKHYQELENLEDGPQLPGPYPVMIALALVPPLFFRIMDPRLDQIESIKASNSQQSP